jgi:hypothetical protein
MDRSAYSCADVSWNPIAGPGVGWFEPEPAAVTPTQPVPGSCGYSVLGTTAVAGTMS